MSTGAVSSCPKGTLGIFYKIKDGQGKTKGYLCGTGHALQIYGIKLDDQRISSFFNKSSHLVVELNGLKAVEEQLKGIIENPRPVIKEQAIKQGATDLRLIIQAEENGKPIYELETVAFQEGIKSILNSKCFNVNSSQEQAELEQKMKLMQEGFEEGSEKKIDEALRNDRVPAELRIEFFDERQRKMAQKIDSLLRGNEGRFFIAIGVGHVIGEKGVPSLLSQSYSWQIKKIH